MTELEYNLVEVPKLPPLLQNNILVQRELCSRHFIDFVDAAWHVVEPGREFHTNWHIEAICDHLEAVSDGEIIKLLINIPPRCMKSLLCSVMWPVWDWIKHPNRRWLTASYGQDLATRDSVKARRLIQSEWFQDRWGDKFFLIGDQNAKERYENNHTGYRLATAVDGIATGEGGDIQIIDDPHNVKQAESDVKRMGAITWLDETMASRFNPPHPPQRVMIMQRVHSNDCSGHVLEQGGYVHLCLPMRFEKVRMYRMESDGITPNEDYVPPTPLGFEDPRQEEEELLWESRFPEGKISVQGEEGTGLADLEHRMGPYAVASQHQQRPVPRGGGMVKRADLQVIPAVPKDVHLDSIRSWDYAATDPDKNPDYTDPDWTAGVLIGKDMKQADPDVYILDCNRFREDPGPRDDIVDQTAAIDGRGVSIWIEQEPGASGKSVIFDARKRLSGFAVNPPRMDPMPAVPGQKRRKQKEAGVPSGNKVQRAEGFATHAHRKKVYIVSIEGQNEWVRPYIQEITTFPLSHKKDQMDATSQGYLRLMERPAGTAQLLAMHGRGLG